MLILQQHSPFGALLHLSPRVHGLNENVDFAAAFSAWALLNITPRGLRLGPPILFFVGFRRPDVWSGEGGMRRRRRTAVCDSVDNGQSKAVFLPHPKIYFVGFRWPDVWSGELGQPPKVTESKRYRVRGRVILCAEARRPDKKMLINIVRCKGVVSAPGACMGMDTAAG
jgi:hypothetical protein